ncbi:hypothetical protein Poli38472_007244 [Pythium oligandrum]|uniref:Uncharacterized protein n=1 Tax=Pythium oligandrum TaxID=41045 RepID=A0A8K1FFL2_PYTOL|nr:hypothetical protein Poli38472_007244 [Pythium oligandrum]|eukprot:TMW59099.1 hypothetical protein Poli38472_007244 [Pythium oligandrum]
MSSQSDELVRAIALIQELHGDGSTTSSAPRPLGCATINEESSESVAHELVYLRAKVRELEAQRANLEERSVAAHVWKQVADRQSAQRYAAELENVKLRVILDTQLEVGKELMRVLELEAPHLVPRGPRFHISFPGVKDVSFDEQHALVDELFLQSNAVFAQFAHDSASNVREMHLEEDDSGGIVVAIKMGWVLPFSADHVQNAVWRITRDQAARRGHLTEEKDSLHVAFEATKLRSVSAAGWQLTKKYTSQDKVPPTIVSYASAQKSKRLKEDQDAVDIRYQDESWVRLVDRVVCGQAMTHVQIGRRVYSAFAMSDPDTPQAVVGSATDHFLHAIDADLSRVQQCIENLLFARRLDGMS